MNILKTIDGHVVLPHSEVYEILYRYINPEVSEPEPDRRMVKDIPEGTRIWFEHRLCLEECRQLSHRNKVDREMFFFE